MLNQITGEPNPKETEYPPRSVRLRDRAGRISVCQEKNR